MKGSENARGRLWRVEKMFNLLLFIFNWSLFSISLVTTNRKNNPHYTVCMLLDSAQLCLASIYMFFI